MVSRGRVRCADRRERRQGRGVSQVDEHMHEDDTHFSRRMMVEGVECWGMEGMRVFDTCETGTKRERWISRCGVRCERR